MAVFHVPQVCTQPAVAQAGSGGLPTTWKPCASREWQVASHVHEDRMQVFSAQKAHAPRLSSGDT